MLSCQSLKATVFVHSSKPQTAAVSANPQMKSRASSKKEAVKLEIEEEGTDALRSARVMRGKLQDFSFTASAKIEGSSLGPTTDTTLSTLKKRKRSPSPVTTASKSSPRKPKVYKMELDTPHPPPANWKVTYHAIEEMRKEKVAPVDTMGCHVPMLDTRIDQRTRRFITLISLMLSSQTKDEVTFAAIQNLRKAFRPVDADSKEEYLTLDAILAASVTSIEECINKVGFWRRKAQYIKSTAEILHKEHGDDIPRTIEGLCSLPGVGMKMAMLTMQVAWGDNVGIGVDVHVHRITNRLGWHRKEAKNPEETRLNLESWLPKEYHPTINPLFVGFGQTVCLPLRAKCDECLLSKEMFTLNIDGEAKEIQGPLCPSAFKFAGVLPKKGRKAKVSESLEDTPTEEAKVKVEIEEQSV